LYYPRRSSRAIELLERSQPGHAAQVRGGYDRTRLEFEFQPPGQAPSDSHCCASNNGSTSKTGAGDPPAALPVPRCVPLSGLTESGGGYNWFLRIAGDSPFFPHSVWFRSPYVPATAASFRTLGPTTSVEPGVAGVSLRFDEPSPNPFSPQTRLSYALPRPAWVRLTIHDVRGRRIATVVNRLERAGPHAVAWDGSLEGGSAAPSGIYFARLWSGGAVVVRKLVLER